jgi:hypothetical protein
MKLLIPFLSAGLVAACGQHDVEPVQVVDHCQALSREADRMIGQQQDSRWKPAGWPREGWCLDCKTGHLEECLAPRTME